MNLLEQPRAKIQSKHKTVCYGMKQMIFWPIQKLNIRKSAYVNQLNSCFFFFSTDNQSHK